MNEYNDFESKLRQLDKKCEQELQDCALQQRVMRDSGRRHPQQHAAELEKALYAADWKQVEELMSQEVRHRTGSQPLDYLLAWLLVFRPLAYATKDDSWGELEKLIRIALRRYYEMRDQLQEIEALVSMGEEWLNAVDTGDNPEDSNCLTQNLYLRGLLAQIKFRVTHRRTFPKK
jgi:hypothetical protein